MESSGAGPMDSVMIELQASISPMDKFNTRISADSKVHFDSTRSISQYKEIQQATIINTLTSHSDNRDVLFHGRSLGSERTLMTWSYTQIIFFWS